MEKVDGYRNCMDSGITMAWPVGNGLEVRVQRHKIGLLKGLFLSEVNWYVKEEMLENWGI